TMRITVAKITFVATPAFFQDIGHETAQRGTGTGQYAGDEADKRPPTDGAGTGYGAFHTGQRRAQFDQWPAVVGALFEKHQTLRNSEQPHQGNHEIDTAIQVIRAERKARHSADRIDADGAQQQTDAGCYKALEQT